MEILLDLPTYLVCMLNLLSLLKETMIMLSFSLIIHWEKIHEVSKPTKTFVFIRLRSTFHGMSMEQYFVCSQLSRSKGPHMVSVVNINTQKQELPLSICTFIQIV